MRILRVVVRGEFDQLTDNARAQLLADQAQHDIFVSSFTGEGTFTYDERIVAFNFRYEVRDTDDLDETEIIEAALERSAAALAQKGLAHKRLRATVTDMASMWE